ncbi:MAG: hypothetical protein ACSW8I_09915 [bacterium]
MEDKELQQLIEAKLWQLENQRQQEEIASRIGHKKIVWPWWLATAAAAAILAAVLLSPVLFDGREETAPILIADANPDNSKRAELTSSSPLPGSEGDMACDRSGAKLGEGDPRNEGGGVCLTIKKHTPPSALRAATPSLPGSKGDMACDRSGANLEGVLADAVHFSTQSTDHIDSADNPELSTPTTPRVHTRRSNRLGDVKKAPEKPQVPALIAHYIDIPDTVLFTSNIVINLK